LSTRNKYSKIYLQLPDFGKFSFLANGKVLLDKRTSLHSSVDLAFIAVYVPAFYTDHYLRDYTKSTR
jgi:hypothetical protein